LASTCIVLAMLPLRIDAAVAQPDRHVAAIGIAVDVDGGAAGQRALAQLATELAGIDIGRAGPGCPPATRRCW
jgi:hypothetical protein